MFDRLGKIFDGGEDGSSNADATDGDGWPEALEDGPYTGEERTTTEEYRLSAADQSILERLATTLADTWPEYDLDRSPASLARLDDLVQTEFGGTPSQTDAVGAYVGEVFVETYDGSWIEDADAGWVVELPGSDGQFALSIPLILEDCLSGTATFASVHAADDSGRTVTYRGQEYDPAELGPDRSADDNSTRTVTYRGEEYDPSDRDPGSSADDEGDDDSGRTVTYRGQEYDPSEIE